MADESRRGFSKKTSLLMGGLLGTGFLSNIANAAIGSDILDYQISEDHPLVDYHPLYALLFDNASRHSPTKKDGEDLQVAIITLARKNFDASAYILLPSFQIRDRRITINIDKMKNSGGNNPTYWATLRLACQGINDPNEYKHRLDQDNFTPRRDPPLPTDPKVIAFANHLFGAWEEAGFVRRLNELPEFAKLFNYKS